MKKCGVTLMALVMAVFAFASDGGFAVDAPQTVTGYGNNSYAAQIGYDSFNFSVRKRLEATRFAAMGSRMASAPILRSEDAYAMAPSSRTSSVRGTSSRRQLDCVYYSGFTIWGDYYATWARQSNNEDVGYRYTASAPAVGFDWSNGNFTVGAATTYNWGNLNALNIFHDQRARNWATTAYAQYDTEKFYGNLTFGYSHNRYSSERADPVADGAAHSASFTSNSINIDAEFGLKFNFKGFFVSPHAGIRYFHDRRGSFQEGGNSGFYNINASGETYYALEVPLGVNVGYAFATGGALIVPQIKFAWIPELARKRGNISGSYLAGGGGLTSQTYSFSNNGAERARNGFQLGAGVEAKITKSLSAHVDYNVVMRAHAYEHHLNLGVGFTF